MSWWRRLLFMVGGLAVMILCLLWVSQFFTGDGDVTPVIWIDDLRDDAKQQGEQPFAEWQDDKE